MDKIDTQTMVDLMTKEDYLELLGRLNILETAFTDIVDTTSKVKDNHIVRLTGIIIGMSVALFIILCFIIFSDV